MVDLTQNPIAPAAQKPRLSNSSSSSSVATLELAVPSPASSQPVVLRRKARRTMGLHLKSTDPAQCLDSIDDMYDIYHQQEVYRRFVPLSLTEHI